MERYFYVKNYAFDPTNSRIAQLSGYYTDLHHNFFFPPIEITRDEAIRMIKSGDVLFLEDGSYRKVKVKLIKSEDNNYLRVDHHVLASDYFG